MGIMHEVYNSGYAQNNKCVFRDWNTMPGEMYEQLLYAGQNYSDQDYELVKKENVIKTNERGNCKEFVLHGSNLAGTIEILKKKLDIAIQGLDVINSMGDSMVKSVAQQTLDAMKDCEDKNSSQDNETE